MCLKQQPLNIRTTIAIGQAVKAIQVTGGSVAKVDMFIRDSPSSRDINRIGPKSLLSAQTTLALLISKLNSALKEASYAPALDVKSSSSDQNTCLTRDHQILLNPSKVFIISTVHKLQLQTELTAIFALKRSFTDSLPICCILRTEPRQDAWEHLNVYIHSRINQSRGWNFNLETAFPVACRRQKETTAKCSS
ncbi:hypothetical protein Y1Q_0010636 [Alligator mississippiensis]|uniref:Uncharacterized protein n=1 Tax=Alligator mississippiensis TaxID=8496 RepID=A0A151M6B9_ALLMI|nr:hypothetical protein Y1Q_0010636 [Alligator mississippiensis]